jgi:hypothetical protein
MHDGRRYGQLVNEGGEEIELISAPSISEIRSVPKAHRGEAIRLGESQPSGMALS